MIGAKLQLEVLDEATLKSKDQMKLNPTGRYPMILHQNTAITGNWPIARLLSSQTGNLGATNALTQARINQWVGFNETQVIPSVQSGDLKDVVKTLNSALTSSKYLAGEHLTYADILVAISLSSASWDKKMKKDGSKVTTWLGELYKSEGMVSSLGEIKI